MAWWIKGLATSLAAQFSPLNPYKKLSAAVLTYNPNTATARWMVKTGEWPVNLRAS